MEGKRKAVGEILQYHPRLAGLALCLIFYYIPDTCLLPWKRA